MSEVDARPPPSRGRSSTRGGRGGFGRGGPRGGRKPVTSGTADATHVEEILEEQGELGEMKKKYAAELGMLKDMFPDWTDVDLVFALQETDGDVPSTVDKITQGNVSQFAEVKKPKDRARSKVKEDIPPPHSSDKGPSRGGRGRGGLDNARGGRGRGSDRGRGSLRGGRGGHATTNGTTKDSGGDSVPTVDSTAWDNTATPEAATTNWDSVPEESAASAWDSTPAQDAGQSAWGNVVTAEGTPATASEGTKSSLIPEGGPKKSWASMFSQPKPAPAPVPVKQAAPQQLPAELAKMEQTAPVAEELQESFEEPSIATQPAVPEVIADEGPVEAGAKQAVDAVVAPAKAPLTEENVEHIPDDSHPPATQTVASTAGSVDTRNVTPLHNQQAAVGRPPLGGFAASAYRATAMPTRSASFQRRVKEQQEAVVMPGHNAVDRAAVQFGSMGLNGEPGPDVDEDREEPETRQAPQHSPPSQPRTSLPPIPRQTAAPQEMPEGLPTPKQAPGLPPASTQNQQQLQDPAIASAISSQDPSHAYHQYNRHGQAGIQQESGAPQQKPYDPFGQQIQASQYDQYGGHAHQQAQQQQSSGFGGLSSAPNDYSSYYTADHTRNAYSQYYGGYGHGQQDSRAGLHGQGQHETNLGQPQRSASGFGATPNDSTYGSQSQQQVSTTFPTFSRSPVWGHQKVDVQRVGPANIGTQDAELAEIIAARTGIEVKGAEEYRLRFARMVEQALQNEREQAVQRKCEQARQSMSAPLVQTLAKDCDAPEFSRADSVGTFTSHGGLNVGPPHHSLPHHPLIIPDVRSDTFSKPQSRFGDHAGSGHNTPNPLAGGQQAAAANPQQAQHSMHQVPSHQQQQQQGGYGAASQGFPYGHPYYNSPYQAAYQNQFGYSQPSGYGSFPGKQGGMYAMPHGGYGSSYEQHSSSPANTGAYSQNQQGSMRSASGMSSGLGGGIEDSGRGSAQAGSHQQGVGGFGGVDPFGRSGSAGFGAQTYAQQSMAGQDDSLKAFADPKGGPSPALGQPGRPGSAANNTGAGQSGLVPPQSQQQQQQQSGFGGYPGFPGQSQYGGLGGLGSHQQQQQQGQQGQQGGMGGMGGAQGGYSGYGGGFGQTYGGYASRGGWGSNYGAH